MRKTEISKENLIELYVNQRLTMEQIAEKFQVHRTTIKNHLKEHGIETTKTVRKFYILKATPITDLQRKLIVGSLLGDACIVKRKIDSYFRVAHCEKQKEYLLWKKEILSNFVNTVNKTIDKRGNSTMYSINTLTHHEMNYYRNFFYENNKKIIRPELINLLNDPLSLAVWYMDDGSRGKYNCRFATDGFSEEENNTLIHILKINFDIHAKVCKYNRNNKEYCFLTLNKPNTLKLFSIIHPYVMDCMRYKLFPEFNISSNDCSPTTTCQNSEDSDSEYDIV